MTFSPLIGSFKGIQEHPWTRDWSWWNPRLYTKHVQLKHNQNPNSFINLQSWRFSDGGWPQWVITDKCSEFSLLSFLWYHASTGTFLVHDYMCTTIALHIQKLWHTWHKRQVITLSFKSLFFFWDMANSFKLQSPKATLLSFVSLVFGVNFHTRDYLCMKLSLLRYE